jgi:EXPB1-like domain 1
MRPLVLIPVLLAMSSLGACGGDDDNDILSNWNGTPMEVDPSCTSARLTQYWSTTWGWCEFPSDRSFLPTFAQNGITLAIAEPWNGGSYGGEPGEACGECWEISTSFATQVVMVHDLCPIEGNPLCAGVHFHLDLTPEAAAAVQGGGNDAATARRVPCPVTGNIHAAILDWNQWGYLRCSFSNHRIAIRSAEVRREPGGEWVAMERSGGAWQCLDCPGSDSGDGVVFRLTSAQGQVVEGTRVVAFQEVSPGHENVVTEDLGLQVDDLDDPPTGQCDFLPDGLVYGDQWGGIDQVKWTPLEWDGANVSETDEGCHAGTSCLRATINQWSGFHLYLRQAFPVDTFSTLRLWARAETETAGTQLTISPSNDGDRCTEQAVDLTPEWQEITFDLASACAGFELLTSVTVQNTTDRATILLDDIEYVP